MMANDISHAFDFFPVNFEISWQKGIICNLVEVSQALKKIDAPLSDRDSRLLKNASTTYFYMKVEQRVA